MANVFTAAAAVMFNDPNLSTAGVFTPVNGGQPVTVRVLRSNVADRVAGGIAAFGSEASADTAEIQVSEVSLRPRDNGTLFYDGRTRRIASVSPAPVKNGTAWLLTLAA